MLRRSGGRFKPISQKLLLESSAQRQNMPSSSRCTMGSPQHNGSPRLPPARSRQLFPNLLLCHRFFCGVLCERRRLRKSLRGGGASLILSLCCTMSLRVIFSCNTDRLRGTFRMYYPPPHGETRIPCIIPRSRQRRQHPRDSAVVASIASASAVQ